MKGSIQKKGKTYFAVVAIGQKRKWFRGGPAQKDAQRVLAEKLNEINHGTYKETPKTSFKEFADHWIKNYAEARLKPSTLAGYKDIILKLLVPAWKRIQISALSIGHLQAFVARRRGQVSAKTVCNEIAVIKEMFKHALRWGYNPAEHLERPKVKKTGIEVLTPDEVKLLLLNTPGHYQVAFLTDVLTGMRAGELWGLHWTEVDWEARQIFVRQALWRGQFQDPKSSYSVRKIDIPDLLLHELRRWKSVSPESPLVFPSPEGKPSCHNNVVKRFFNPALEKAKLRHVSFHSLRHTNASMRIAAGQNIKYIQTQLGHASIKMTLDIYGHLFNDANFSRQQVKLLEASLPLAKAPMESVGLPIPGERYPALNNPGPNFLSAAPDG
jgi:integrase